MVWVFLAAALLPFVGAVAAKAGGKSFDNNAPRQWLAHQQGWRARANAAQANTFESLPFFFAALLFALYQGVDPSTLMSWAWLWIVLRLFYVWIYIKDRGALRSLIWFLALLVNIYILFLGV